MPRGDGTGPMGMGPMTGYGRGLAGGNVYGRRNCMGLGYGPGNGMRNGYGFGFGYINEPKDKLLKRQKEILEMQLKAIEDQMEEN